MHSPWSSSKAFICYVYAQAADLQTCQSVILCTLFDAGAYDKAACVGKHSGCMSLPTPSVQEPSTKLVTASGRLCNCICWLQPACWSGLPIGIHVFKLPPLPSVGPTHRKVYNCQANKSKHAVDKDMCAVKVSDALQAQHLHKHTILGQVYKRLSATSRLISRQLASYGDGKARQATAVSADLG